MKTNDDMCCTVCGERDDLIEYHMTGWLVNSDDKGYNNAYSGGVDYPTEYIWCGKCQEDCDIELFENWHERTTNQ
jgi:hypothetical protein